MEYLLDSVLASTMISNSEYIVMLNQAEPDRAKPVSYTHLDVYKRQALKISGTGAKHLAVMLYAVLKEKKKTKGRVRPVSYTHLNRGRR